MNRINLPLPADMVEQSAPAQSPPQLKLVTHEAPQPHREYIEHGWQVVAIPPGSKGPIHEGWNTLAGCLKPDAVLPEGYGVGLCHAYSGTAAIDVNSYPEASAWLAERGIDLLKLLQAPDAVQIDSGNPGHGKLIYGTPLGMAIPSKKIIEEGKTILEFRCGTAGGLTVQDCLVGTTHPDTGKPYTWAGLGDWRHLPQLPPELFEVWQQLIEKDSRPADQKPDKQQATTMLPELLSALRAISPDCDRKTWIEVGMGVHAAGLPEGFQLWNEWSKQSAKYNVKEMPAQWRSFKDNPQGITVATVFHHAVQAGWIPPQPDMSGKFGPVPPAQPKPAKEGHGVNLVSASDLTPEKIEWLWHGYLARGKLHVLAGQAGTGKTTIALSLAAIVTRGGKLPDGSTVAASNVLIWSGEDGIADTLLPRLIAAGADIKRIFFTGLTVGDGTVRPFDPASDLPDLVAKAEAVVGGIALMIVDPVVNVITGNSHGNAEVRRDLQPLVNLADRLHCAVIGITHFTKGTEGKNPLDRVTGSLALAAVARVVFATGKTDEVEGDGNRVFCRVKSNIGKDDGGFRYSLEMAVIPGDIEASRVRWHGAVEGHAKELLGDGEDKKAEGDAAAKTHAAMVALVEMLRAAPLDSDVAQNTIQESFGIHPRTIRRAREKLGIRPVGYTNAMSKYKWSWSLPWHPPEMSNEEVVDFLLQQSKRGFGEVKQDDNKTC